MERKSPAPLRYQTELCDRPLTTEITQEISLPDYQPEIKRLLRVSASAQPPSRYLGGGSAEFSGAVDFNILYAAADGNIYCFPTSADYSFRVPVDADSSFDLSDALCCYCLCEPDMTGGRVLGPRRMSIRCRLRARTRAYATATLAEAWSAEPRQIPQRLLHEATVARVRSGSSAPITLTDEIIPERDGRGDEYRIISAFATVMPEEISTAGAAVHCRGQLAVRLLMQHDSDPAPAPVALLRKLPFTTEIPIDGLAPGADAAVHGCCTELRLTLENGKVLCEAEIVLSAQTQQEISLPYTADICCIGQRAQCESVTLHAPRPLCCLNANFTQNESLPTEELALPLDAAPIDVSGYVLPDSIKVSCDERGRCTVSGTCRYSLILGGEDPSTKELEMPFRYTCDLPHKAAGTPLRDYDCRVSVITARPRLDAQRLTIDAELYLCARLWGYTEFTPVISTTLCDAPAAPAASRILCYPTSGETLWSVAKQYCRCVNTLAHNNHLPNAPRADAPDSLGGAHVLII